MERFFCFGKNDFCNKITDEKLFSCGDCEFIDGKGGEFREYYLDVVKDIFGDDYDLDRLRELVEADRDGRAVVLSEPMKPMVYKSNDTDVYCPACGHTLSGGWPLSDADDYRKMCQCPNCGQSIDDTKCESSESLLKGEQDG